MTDKTDFVSHQVENRREFSRVSAFVPFDFRAVPPEDADFFKARGLSDGFMADVPVTPNLDDQMYGEWFKLINAKLDELLRMTAMQREGFSTLPFQKISISGNGMSFLSSDAFDCGTILESKVILTTYRPMALFLYGVVVHAAPQEKGYRIAVSFINMDDSIRNEIIRFVFEREREMIREKRGC